MSNALVYATSIVYRHPEPGEFARVLIPAPCGTRYDPVKVERASSTKAARWTPQPLELVGKKPHGAKPRWTPERIDALPKTSGYLTLVGHSELGNSGVVTVTLRCNGPHDRCRKSMITPAATWAKESSRQKACLNCAKLWRSKANPAFTAKGYALAREHAEKLKAAAR